MTNRHYHPRSSHLLPEYYYSLTSGLGTVVDAESYIFFYLFLHLFIAADLIIAPATY